MVKPVANQLFHLLMQHFIISKRHINMWKVKIALNKGVIFCLSNSYNTVFKNVIHHFSVGEFSFGVQVKQVSEIFNKYSKSKTSGCHWQYNSLFHCVFLLNRVCQPVDLFKSCLIWLLMFLYITRSQHGTIFVHDRDYQYEQWLIKIRPMSSNKPESWSHDIMIVLKSTLK